MQRLMTFALGMAVAVTAAAQQRPRTLEAADRSFAHEVLRMLIETNTTHSSGSTTEAAEKMRDVLLKAGFPAADMEIVGPSDKRMNLVVRYRAAKGTATKPVLTIIHLDVVEAKRTDWTVDPFVLTEKDGYFYGRGTQDVKTGVAAFVTSFAMLKRAGFAPKRDLILALTADEEGGSENGVEWLLKNRRDLVDAGLVVNPDAGGLVLRNGVPEQMGLEATEKTYADFDLVATNPGGHSSRPVPDNALYAVADALGRLEHAAFPAELNTVTRAYYEAQLQIAPTAKRPLIRRLLQTPMDQDAARELSADPADNAILHTTCVGTMMQAGHAANALPASADATVNCRILPGHTAEETRERLVAIVADPRVAVKYRTEGGDLVDKAPARLSVAPPPLSPEVMRPLRSVTQAMWPGVPIVPEMESGASDSIYTSSAGIPSYGFSGIGVDEDDDRAHGRDERVRVEAFFQGVEFTRRFVQAIGGE